MSESFVPPHPRTFPEPTPFQPTRQCTSAPNLRSSARFPATCERARFTWMLTARLLTYWPLRHVALGCVSDNAIEPSGLVALHCMGLGAGNLAAPFSRT